MALIELKVINCKKSTNYKRMWEEYSTMIGQFLTTYNFQLYQVRIRLEIEIEIELKFNQSEERKLVFGLVNFALIGQNPIQSQS